MDDNVRLTVLKFMRSFFLRKRPKFRCMKTMLKRFGILTKQICPFLFPSLLGPISFRPYNPGR